MNHRFSFVVEESGDRIDLFLARKTGESRRFIKYQLDRGNISLNKKVVEKPSQKVRPGDRVEVSFEKQEPLDLKPIPGNLDILYEDSELLVLNKAQGTVVHPATGHRGETLVHHLLHHLQENKEFTSTSLSRPGIVHRLDRGTSGCIVVAKNRKSLEGLSRQFKNRTVKKEYEAIAWGSLNGEGVYKSSMGRDLRDRKKMSSKTADPREALTVWKTETCFKHFSHVALFPQTGRTHQLRVHLSEGGHPILGDDLYNGKPAPKRLQGLAMELQVPLGAVASTLLHARRLTLHHPETGAVLSFSAERPKGFDDLLKLLGDYDL